MDDAVDPALLAVEIAMRRVFEQERSIAWQRELIASLKEDGHWEVARKVQTVLDQMIEMLAAMRSDLAAMRCRALDLTDPLDEKSLDAVMRDCPL